MANKNKPKQSPLQAILAAIVVVIAGVIYIVSGVDLTGGNLGVVTTVPQTTSVSTTAPTTRPTTASASATPAPVVATAVTNSNRLTTFTLENALGASRSFWRVYFTVPQTDRTKWVNSIDAELAKAIDGVRSTLDIAAFEWNNPALTKAVLDAHKRGVAIRMVADSEHTIDDSDSTIKQLADAGIPIVYDNRSAFMHNKFMLLDGATLWMGSMNFQQNDIFRNNNNVLVLNSTRAVQTYKTEFESMFIGGKFGPNKPANTASFTEGGTNIQIYFASQNDVVNPIVQEIAKAQTQIRFMAFSYTLPALSAAMIERANAGINVEGIFEQRGSETASSQLRALKCAGTTVFQDGNPGTMHHKVIIIDNSTVITGSFNFSNNAINSNDENLVIIRNADIARQYLQEYERVRAVALDATRVTC